MWDYPVLLVIGALMLLCALVIISTVPEVLAATLTALIITGVFALTT